MAQNPKSNRRSFLKLFAGLIGLVSAGGVGYYYFRNPPAGKIESMYSPLVDPAFAMATTRSITDLSNSLIAMNIINPDGSINHERIKNNLMHDPIIQFQGKYYTESEYALYHFAYILCQLPADQIEAYFN